jgi:hypothetical protein
MHYIFDASQVHFRAALDQARLARERHTDSEGERHQGLSGTEPRARERDATIVTVVLTQAAAECYGSWVQLKAGRHPGWMSWRKAWEEMPEAAEALGRPHDFKLGPDRNAVLDHVANWRNYLMHTDPSCRDRLRAALVERGDIGTGDDENAIVNLLNADLAESMTKEFETLFRWAEGQTGIAAPFTLGAWPGEGFRRLGSQGNGGKRADGGNGTEGSDSWLRRWLRRRA